MTKTNDEDKPKLFKTLYLDPPFSPAQQGARGASRHYDLMSMEELRGMAPAIKAIMSENSTILMWTTNAALPDALALMNEFGYRYISNVVWDKSPHLGLGNYFRNSHELLLHGVRGKAPFKFHGQRTIINFPRMGHSVKPSEVIGLIERVVDGPYAELFARSRPNSRSDWSIWGMEVDSDLSLADWGYYVPSDFARQDTDGERSV